MGVIIIAVETSEEALSGATGSQSLLVSSILLAGVEMVMTAASLTLALMLLALNLMLLVAVLHVPAKSLMESVRSKRILLS